jgi:hypothetical protein
MSAESARGAASTPAASHRPYARGHVQMPKGLLRSPDHSALAVVVWAYYETLTVPRMDGS